MINYMTATYAPVVEEIIKEVDQKDYDMIVMGAHGHGAIAGAVMGSVSRRAVDYGSQL